MNETLTRGGGGKKTTFLVALQKSVSSTRENSTKNGGKSKREGVVFLRRIAERGQKGRCRL